METEREIVDHMSVYDACPDVIFPLPWRRGDDASIHVHKMGGGALDAQHAGTWIVQLYRNGGLVDSTAEMVTGTPKSHYEVAGLYAMFLLAGWQAPTGTAPERYLPLVNRLDEFHDDVMLAAEQNGRQL